MIFGFKKNKDKELPEIPQEPNKKSEDEGGKKIGILSRLKQQLSRTREGIAGSLAQLLLGKKTIDDDLLEEIESKVECDDIISGYNTGFSDINSMTSG